MNADYSFKGNLLPEKLAVNFPSNFQMVLIFFCCLNDIERFVQTFENLRAEHPFFASLYALF